MPKKGESKKPIILSANPADPHGLTQSMERYLEWMRVKNYAGETVEARRFYIGVFVDWCESRSLIRPSEITKPILERYQRHLFHYRKQDGDPLTFRSQYNRIVALRTWFKWLTKHNFILMNPASELDLPKLDKRLPRAILTEQEAETVINQPDVTTATGLRDRAILETFYSTGIRRFELMRVAVHDLDPERGTLFIRHGKGKKDRIIPIGERAIAWITKYLNDVRPELACGRDQGILFLTHLGEAFTPNRLTQLARTYVEKAKLHKAGACHLFRHTMATLMLENGADIRFIQAMLGHAELSTTQIYTQVSIKKLKEVHTLTHPAKATRSKKVDWSEDPAPTADELLSALAAEAEEESEDVDEDARAGDARGDA